jgi:hypothetical protein
MWTWSRAIKVITNNPRFFTASGEKDKHFRIIAIPAPNLRPRKLDEKIDGLVAEDIEWPAAEPEPDNTDDEDEHKHERAGGIGR